MGLIAKVHHSVVDGVAGAALMTDYVLNVAVGISAGVGALVSAVPQMEKHTLLLCLVILVAITIVNLRGTKEAGAVFMIPTYLFLGTLGGAIVFGIFKTLVSGCGTSSCESGF